MDDVYKKLLELQRKVDLYEFTLQEILCIMCEEGHAVIPNTENELADQVLSEVQLAIKNLHKILKKVPDINLLEL